MLAAFAEAARAFDNPDYLTAARRNARFILSELRTPEGRLLRTWKDGRASLNGYLEDYSYLLEGLLALYQATFESEWFAAAREIADVMIERFADPQGGFFDTSDDHERLITRPEERSGQRYSVRERHGGDRAVPAVRIDRRRQVRRGGRRAA